MKKRLLSLALALVLGLGLVVPTFAAESTFVDVPENYWGYTDIKAAAEKGYMVGVSSTHFDPEGTVNVAQFLTLLGRMVFPEVTTEGSTWYGPYVEKAQASGLLTGSLVDTNDVWAGISRYDMAVILRAAAKKLGIAEKTAAQADVNDYGIIPNMYTEAVLAVYGMGLITGDNKHNFNGSATMRRAEVAVVIMRLDRAMPTGGTTTQPTESANPTTTPQPTESEKPTEFVPPTVVDMPTDEKMVTYTVKLWTQKTDHAMGRPVDDKYTYLPSVPIKLYYTPDGGKTAILVAEGATDKNADALLEFQAPENWSSMANYLNGNGFFVSTETTYNGEKLVTSDLRTDGRNYLDLRRLTSGKNQGMDIDLTSPDGEKAKFTVKGHVLSDIDPLNPDVPLSGFTVQLHLADGRVVGEAVSGADGSFSMECEVDALDGGFNVTEAIYYSTAVGYVDGIKYERTGKYLGEDRLILESLQRMGVWSSVFGPQNSDYRIEIKERHRSDSQ